MTKRSEECDAGRRNIDARDAIANEVEIGAQRERGIGFDPIRREQVRAREGCKLSCRTASESDVQM